MDSNQIVVLLEKKKGDSTWKELAKTIGCSTAYLSDVINGRREPGPRILSYLGLEKSYRKVTAA